MLKLAAMVDEYGAVHDDRNTDEADNDGRRLVEVAVGCYVNPREPMHVF